MFDVSAMEKLNLPLTVIGRSNEVYAKVNANNMTNFEIVKLRNILGHGNMQKPFAVLCDQLCCTKLPVVPFVKILFHSLAMIMQFDPTFQCVDREQPFCKRVVPVPHKVVFRVLEVWAYPFALVFQNGFVSSNNGLHDRLCHLGTKPEYVTKLIVENFI